MKDKQSCWKCDFLTNYMNKKIIHMEERLHSYEYFMIVYNFKVFLLYYLNAQIKLKN